MNTQREIIEAIKQVDLWYNHLFDYVFLIDDKEYYKRCNNYCNLLQDAELFYLLEVHNPTNKADIIKNITKIINTYKDKYTQLVNEGGIIKQKAINQGYYVLDIISLLENHYKNLIKYLEDNTTSMSSDKIELQFYLHDLQLKILYNEFISHGFIANDTEIEHFKNIFYKNYYKKNNTPIVWTLKSSKNKNALNKKTLIEFFQLLKAKGLCSYSNDATLYKFIKMAFADSFDVGITVVAANKPKENSPSENRLKLEAILSKL